MRNRLLAGLLTAALAAVSLAPAPTLAGTTGGLRGRVVDRDTQQGLPGVKVTVASPSQTASTTTDANGAFGFISLIPDTYTISVQPPGYEGASDPGITIIADQVQQASLAPTKITTTIGRVTSRSSSNLVKSGVTGDVYSVNSAAALAAQTLGGAGSVNQAYSAMASVPGVSLQMGQQGWNQAVYVRGGDYEDVAYELDGIPVQRASDGAPITTLTNLGQGELQVYTGGAPASADASGLSGYVNQVVRSGTNPGFIDVQAAIGGSALYNKLQAEVGGATTNGNFTYYVGALAVDQGYRYGDNFNGASDPLYFYPLGPSPLGPTNYSDFIPAGGNNYSIASTSDREVIGNFHYKLQHKYDAGNDDLQLLFANGRIFADFYSSENDLGGVNAVTNAIGTPAYWQDSYTYTGTVFAPLNQSQITGSEFPSSPLHPWQAPLDPNLRDTNDNGFSLFKLQWQRNIDDHSYLRVFAYTDYNDWFINGPVSANLPYSGEIADYEVHGNTYGLNLRYENQLDAKNLLTATASYQQQHSESYDSGASPYGPVTENLVDAQGNCLGPTGAYVSCFTPTTSGGGLFVVSQYGSTPSLAPPYAAPAGAQWLVTENGQSALNNIVNPIFSSGSIGDQFRPVDKLLINVGVRFEDYYYKLSDTTDEPARSFWFAAWNRENCYYPGATAPVNSSANLDATGTYTVCGPGAIPLVNSSPASVNFSAWQPRVSTTYTISPDTVLRASYGRYAQQPGGEYQQYNYTQQNSATPLSNFLPYGFNTPFHSTAPSYSNSYDFSLEQHIPHTDVSFKITPFYRVTQNVEQDIPIGAQGVVDGLNTGTGQSKGVEVEINKGDFAKNGFAVQLSYTFTNSGTQFNNFPGQNTNFIDNLNTYIQQYNAFTSACAPGGKAAGTSVCGSTPSGVIAAPAYSAATGAACASAQAAGCVVNPYYNQPLQPLLDRSGTYTPYDILPSNPYYGDVGFVTPTVVTAILNYRHNKFAITPSATYTSGTFYGAPLSTPGYDPSTCSATIGGGNAADTTSCSGSIFIPDQYSGTFDKQGQFEEPTRLTVNLQSTYDFSRRLRLTVAASGIVDHCYQRGYAWDNSSTCVYAQLPSNLLAPVGNYVTPVSSAPVQLQYPYGSFYNNVQTGFSGQKMPLTFFANLEFRL